MATTELTVLIDPGHGGKDPGAVAADGTRESDIALSVGIMVAGILQAIGCNAHLTRHVDAYQSLGYRCAMEHILKPDCFISLHCNAAYNRQANGIEVWTSPGDTPADPLARELFVSLQRSFPSRRYRSDYTDGDPDREGKLYVLQNTHCPAVLVEMGFISNSEECKWLQDPENQRRIALAVVDGVMVWRQDAAKKSGPELAG